MVKVSAVQAASLIGRNERRIRDWITKHRLPATKVGKTWQIETDDLERISGIKIDDTQLALLPGQESIQSLLERIALLERMLDHLSTEITTLYTRMSALEHPHPSNSRGDTRALHQPNATEPSAINLQRYIPLPHSPEQPPEGVYGQEIDSLPAGSMRMKQFALLHKVHAAVLNYQIETGKIEDTTMGMVNGRKAHWLTPQQQYRVITFWRRNGTHFLPCTNCPHYSQDLHNP